jgi:hypothetical protein
MYEITCDADSTKFLKKQRQEDFSFPRRFAMDIYRQTFEVGRGGLSANLPIVVGTTKS